MLTEYNISLTLDISNLPDIISMLNDSDLTNLSSFEPDPSTFACEAPAIPTEVKVGVCAFCLLVFLLALPGNALVWLVLGRSRQALLPSDLYLLHLVVADLLLALTLPFWAVAVLRGWQLGVAVCKMVRMAYEASFYCSILFLACISSERYQLIARAQSAQEARRGCVRRVCVAIWLLGGAMALPALMSEVVQPAGWDAAVCAESYSQGAGQWWLTSRLLRHTLGFLLPLGAILLCYGAAAVRLVQRSRASPRRRRATRLIAAVVTVFLLCWVPHHLAVTMDTMQWAGLLSRACPIRLAVDRAVFVTQGLALLHSCVNPVLYAFVGQKFRRNLKQMLLRSKAQERTSGSKASGSTSHNSNGMSTAL